jgi:hypothetical protein
MTTGDAPARGPIRIGSRGSALALVQARWTADRLRQAGIRTEIVIVRTAGDDRAPDTAWGEGAFVGAIESALLDGRIDVAVHSAKDVPTEEDPRLVIAAWTAARGPARRARLPGARDDARDPADPARGWARTARVAAHSSTPCDRTCGSMR